MFLLSVVGNWPRDKRAPVPVTSLVLSHVETSFHYAQEQCRSKLGSASRSAAGSVARKKASFFLQCFLRSEGEGSGGRFSSGHSIGSTLEWTETRFPSFFLGEEKPKKWDLASLTQHPATGSSGCLEVLLVTNFKHFLYS